jgi:purine nucleosidase
MEPAIADRIVVVWLGGNPGHWHQAVEFNVEQDMHASHVLLDSGVPLVHVPCRNVTEHLRTTSAEIDRHVRGTGSIGDYLADIYTEHYTDHFARSKVLWDVGAVAWLVEPEWVPTVVLHSPVLTSEGTWSHDPHRHLIREALWTDRDAIFGDLFRKLAA